MLAKALTGSLWGLNSHLVTVEVDLQSNLPSFHIVGLPDGIIRESKERIKAALQNSNLEYPQRRIVVNLAPADLKKEGTAFDLPVAIAILAAAKRFPSEALQEILFLGELSLTGEIKPNRGVIAHLMMAREQKLKKAIIPKDNLPEASLFKDIEVLGTSHLTEIISYLAGQSALTPSSEKKLKWEPQSSLDMADIQGHKVAKRALEIAVAGKHNLLFLGPPGSGKTLLAKSMPSILPELEEEKALEVAKIKSIVQEKSNFSLNPPFVSPHHTISHIALIGGGACPKPGMVTQAHHGVLFLDEVGEFERRCIEVLRQVIEEKKIMVSRAQGSQIFPADFLFVLASNPCPCGFYTHPEKACICSQSQIIKYRSKLSGPILDRVDMHLNVQPIKNFLAPKKEEPSSIVRERVIKARLTQKERFSKKTSLYYNSQIPAPYIFDFCPIDTDCKNLLEKAIQKMHLSHRSFHHILKVARTISDLEESKNIQKNHLLEALQYRKMEDQTWVY